jgi:hypothetical protein
MALLVMWLASALEHGAVLLGALVQVNGSRRVWLISRSG